MLTVNTSSHTEMASTAASTSGDPTARFLESNPHVLFPKPPIRMFARQDNWVLHTVRLGDTVVEFSLTLVTDKQAADSYTPTSSSSSSSSGTSSSSSSKSRKEAAAEANGGAAAASSSFHQVTAPTVVPVKRRSVWSWLILFLCLLSLSVAVVRPDFSRAPVEAAADAGIRLLLAYLLTGLLLPAQIVQENVVAIRGVGVQMTSVYDTGRRVRTFVQSDRIRAALVNEGIQGCDVRYYLALLVAGREGMVLLFDAARPRLPVLSHIYRHLLQCMTVPLLPGQASDSGLVE